MGDYEPLRRSQFRAGVRALLVAALSSTPLVACGRTTLLLPEWSEGTSAMVPTGGAFGGNTIGAGAPSPSRAGSATSTQNDGAARAGANGVVGSAGSALVAGAS